MLVKLNRGLLVDEQGDGAFKMHFLKLLVFVGGRWKRQLRGLAEQAILIGFKVWTIAHFCEHYPLVLRLSYD